MSAPLKDFRRLLQAEGLPGIGEGVAGNRGEIEGMKPIVTSEGYILDRRLRQGMAPSMRRILEYMEANPGRHADQELAAACHCDRGNAKDVLNRLHQSGILRIAAYRSTGSTPQALYGWACEGRGDAAYPPPVTNAEKQRKRREKLKRMYGEYAWRVHTSRNHGGAETLVLDGKVVYRRKPKRG